MKQLKTYIDNPQEVQEVLQRVNIEFETDAGDPIDVLLIYLQCEGGKCKYFELFQIIRNSIMTNFVLSYSEIANKLKIKQKKSPEELFKKAVRKISKTTAKGELGELLLFTLIEVYLKAPKIFSKMSHKTSRRKAYHGTDAVHAQYVEGKLRLYLGESKLHKSFSGAVSKAVKSISNSLERYEDEFDLIESHIDFPGIDDEDYSDLIELLNPFSDTDHNIYDILYTPCFIGFVNPIIFNDDEDTYLKNYIEVAKDYIEIFYTNLEKNNSSVNKTALMLLPFNSIDDLVEGFIDHMGIKE